MNELDYIPTVKLVEALIERLEHHTIPEPLAAYIADKLMPAIVACLAE